METQPEKQTNTSTGLEQALLEARRPRVINHHVVTGLERTPRTMEEFLLQRKERQSSIHDPSTSSLTILEEMVTSDDQATTKPRVASASPEPDVPDRTLYPMSTMAMEDSSWWDDDPSCPRAGCSRSRVSSRGGCGPQTMKTPVS